MNTTDLSRICKIDERIDELKAEEKTLRQERDKLEARLIDEFCDAGVQNMNIAGRTAYMETRTWIKAQDPEEAKNILKKMGWDDCLNVGTQRLSARYREYETPEEFWAVVGPALQEALFVDEVTKIKTRKA